MSGHIHTTHVGSLPRSKAVTDLVFAAERGDPVDAAEFDRVIGAAVDDIMRRQVEVGVNLVSDGEMSKISYATYIKDRITGFDGDSPRTPPADLEDFPNFLKLQAAGGGDAHLPPPEMHRPGRAQDAGSARGRSSAHGGGAREV
jgi:5-methyltetrahydropteroyltriglutamate--homocysteine methyltransferase